MADPRVVVQSDKASLGEHVANRFVGLLAQLTQQARPVHVSLTGGSMGVAVLEATAAHAWRDNIDWSLVHFWWSDERFVPRADPERNAGQARAALLSQIAIPAENVHEPAATDDGVSLDERRPRTPPTSRRSRRRRSTPLPRSTSASWVSDRTRTSPRSSRTGRR